MSAPRLRCIEQRRDSFLGTYKGHRVEILRDHPSRPFCFLVSNDAGERLADGIMDRGATMRETIIHALKGALLFP